MDATQALAELSELSSQVVRAVVLDAKGSVLASSVEDGDALAGAARELLTAAGQLHASAGDVTRAEVELTEGALFVLSEGGRTIAATTGPNPTSGLIVYDLRTCLAGIDEEKPKRQRARKPKKSEDA